MWVEEGSFLGDQSIVEHCHYFRISKKNVNDNVQRNATRRNATRRNATQRNATQRNATQRNAIKLRHSTQSTIDGRENYFKAMFLLLLFVVVFIFI